MKKSTFVHVTLAALLSAAMGLSHAESNGALTPANNNDGGAAANPVSETSSGAKSTHKAKKRHHAKRKHAADSAMSGNLDDSQPTAAGTTTAPDKMPRDTNEPTGRYRPDNGTGASAPGTARTDR